MNRISILNIPFDNITEEAALEKIETVLHHSKKPFFIATPNPEILLEARKNKAFREVLQKTDLNIADGIGIILASQFQKTPLLKRVTGVDFMQKICEQTAAKHKIFLLGAKKGVADQVKQKLEQKIPNIKIVGTYSGSPNPEDEQKICTLINKSEADILFVAFGAPKQELWLDRNLPKLPKIKLAMGVGGAFDFIAGVRKRAPVWMQKLWLEWLFRLIQEPKRIKRIFNATVKFPLVFLLSDRRKKE